jgi:hypothetical protein
MFEIFGSEWLSSKKASFDKKIEKTLNGRRTFTINSILLGPHFLLSGRARYGPGFLRP